MKIQHGHKGFRLTFFNGLTLSVQYGVHNYCERQNYSAGWDEPSDPSEIVSGSFEWAVWGEHDLLSMGGDQVEGHVPFDLLPLVIDRAQRLKPGSKFVEPIGWTVCDAVMELQPQHRADMVRVLLSK
jgi:hypothetical protein